MLLFHHDRNNSGVWHAVIAYAIWGAFPLYWKLLHHVPALQLMCHRIVWSFLGLGVIVIWTGKNKTLRKALSGRNIFPIYIATGILIGTNWLLYVWAVNAGFIVETSLGYFINPLLSVLIGVIFLRERLRLWQWLPIGVATAGVLYLTYAHGSPPWIALALASTFAMYAFLKKLAPLGSLEGLILETGFLFIPVLIYLVYSEMMGHGAFLHCGIYSDILIVAAGIVTTVPLIFFAIAVRRIPLNVIGILQYITPTIQFLIGVFVFKEPFASTHMIGFGLIWLALFIFGTENILWQSRQKV